MYKQGGSRDRPMKVIESIYDWDTMVAFSGPGLDMFEGCFGVFNNSLSLVSYNYFW